MVNFNDPIVIARESSTLLSFSLEVSKSESNWTHLPDKVDRFWSFVNGIFMCVWLLLPLCRFDVSYNSILTALPAGSL
jgi:hypothetical protein